MNEEQQRAVIQKAEFFGHLRDRLRQILVADFSYEGFLTLDVDGVQVQFCQQGYDANLKVGLKDAPPAPATATSKKQTKEEDIPEAQVTTTGTEPIYEWTAPIAWMGVV